MNDRVDAVEGRPDSVVISDVANIGRFIQRRPIEQAELVAVGQVAAQDRADDPVRAGEKDGLRA